MALTSSVTYDWPRYFRGKPERCGPSAHVSTQPGQLQSTLLERGSAGKVSGRRSGSIEGGANESERSDLRSPKRSRADRLRANLTILAAVIRAPMRVERLHATGEVRSRVIDAVP